MQLPAHPQALERRDVHGSVMCLRKQLAKSRAKPDRLHRLAACILCATPEELRRTANWARRRACLAPARH